jgi:siroheme synthase
MELPSLQDKLQYMGEAVSDHRHAVAVVGGVTSYMAVRRMIRAVLSRRATRSALWKRALLRRQSSASPDKTIFGAGDDSPIRMLI